ncbi:PLC-like phosphodiesterase [Cokeromyces recurvatus]|uniref:PLC-like phosphodiesterase n=1 Tax=Cokeromyces recurvatus TaxID=90255 RepID=UPI00222122C5|nr:PLC-like phosphodiesterase [Cokeromyces recurvatus]KAI7906561.1 PLC-like phosphodiesterase [Cokeromyces recurvatus]
MFIVTHDADQNHWLLLNVIAECNGGSNLCQQSYSNITHLITHDSYALSPNIAATQDYDIINQLSNGVRGIKLSAVPSLMNPNRIHLCHTTCAILDAGSITDTLNNITIWLQSNPKEVITIMWNNLYDLDASQIAMAYESSHIIPFIYLHNNSLSSWPTLQEMIDSGKRVVNFIDSKADPVQIPWLMDQFSNIFETPYDNTDINSFNCNVDRIAPNLNPKDLMYVLNHFIYGVVDIAMIKIEIPSRIKAQAVNAKPSLSQHIQNCTTIFQKKPNFIEVDFYTIGDASSIVAELNGVTLKRPIMPLSISTVNKPTTTKLSNVQQKKNHHVTLRGELLDGGDSISIFL